MNLIAYLKPPRVFEEKADSLVTNLSDFLSSKAPFPRYHCTLMTSEIDNESAEFILRKLEKIKFSPFKLNFSSIQLYNNSQYANLATEIKKSNALRDLQSRIKSKYVDWIDFSEETMPRFKEDFSPHITLAYQGNRNKTIPFQKDIFEGISWTCNSFKVSLNENSKSIETYEFPL